MKWPLIRILIDTKSWFYSTQPTNISNSTPESHAVKLQKTSLAQINQFLHYNRTDAEGLHHRVMIKPCPLRH